MIQQRSSSRAALTVLAVMAFAIVLDGSPADAQIVGTATGNFVANDPNTQATFSYSLQGGGNALVVGTYIDNTHTISNMQFAGVAPNRFVNDQRMNLFYFPNPAASGAFTFDFTLASLNNPSTAFFIYELLEVDLLAPVDTGTGATITTTVDDQFIIDFIAVNNDDGADLTPAAGSLLTLQGIANGNGDFGGGSIGSASVDGSSAGAAGVKTLGWQGFGDGFPQGEVSIALAASPLAVPLTLIVNKTNEQMHIRNDSGGPVSFNYYVIESDANALDPAGWSSLKDQNYDSSLLGDLNNNGVVNGTDLAAWESAYGANGSADGNDDGDSDGLDFLAWQRDLGKIAGPTQRWIEAGGSNSGQIGELFQSGATTLEDGEEVSLGAAYNKAIFGAGDGDLVFRVSTGTSTALGVGTVTYVTSLAAVPESASVALCFMALVMVAWKRWRYPTAAKRFPETVCRKRGGPKVYRSILFCSVALGLWFAQSAFAADNGDGTFTNPPLNADFPDPDVIRVGDDFYMVSTTFVNSPGLAVLHSNDLVNWTTIGNVVDRLEGDPRFDMIGGTLYRNGVYASSIRYRNGTFYIAMQPNGASPGQGLQIWHTQDPAGDWQLNQLNGGAFDPGLFFDDDGTPYVFYGGPWQTNIFVRQLTPNLDGFVGAGQAIFDSGFAIEGSHAIKRGNYYYVFNSRPGQGAMYVSRSTSLNSGWTTVPSINNGTGSGHQGGVVELESGDWYGFTHFESGPVGRVTNISPVAWENDWPIWGDNNVIPGQAPKPILGQPIVVHPVSTGFDGPNLLPDYRWNHNPDDSRWSLTERPGYLRLHTTVAPDFWNARNTLTHKGFGPTSQAIVEMDITNLQTGDRAGLGMLGKGLATLAVQRLAGGQVQLVLSTGTATADSGPVTQQATAALGTPSTVYLTLRMDFQLNQGQTAYSIDGLNWSTIGNSFPLLWDWATGTFQGEQYAVFNYNSGASTGYVDVNRVSFIQRSDLDLDGDIDEDDYVRFATYHLANLAGDSPIETFPFGDLDGDLDNDYKDFLLFGQDYIAAHDEEALDAAIAAYESVPEPYAFAIMALCGVLMTTRRFSQHRLSC